MLKQSRLIGPLLAGRFAVASNRESEMDRAFAWTSAIHRHVVSHVPQVVLCDQENARRDLNDSVAGKKIDPPFLFPMCRPPFNDLLIEFDFKEGTSVGALISVIRPLEFCVNFFVRTDTNPSGLAAYAPVSWIVVIDERGDFVRFHRRENYEETGPDTETNVTKWKGILWQCLMVLSWMNCKNIETRVESSKKVILRLKDRRPKKATIVIKTLRLSKDFAARMEAAAGDGVKVSRRLHSRRGYYGDYRPPRGKLFGKLEGTFWFPEKIRGDKEAGAVLKNYELPPGVDEPPAPPEGSPDA